MVSLNLACSPDSTHYFILTFCWELKINADNYNYVQPITKVDLLEMFHSFSPVGFLQLESEWEGEKIKNNVTTPKHLQCQTPSFSKKLPLCTRLKRKGQHASKICFHCSWARHIYLMFCFIRSERGEILLILAWTLITLLQKSDALSA